MAQFEFSVKLPLARSMSIGTKKTIDDLKTVGINFMLASTIVEEIKNNKGKRIDIKKLFFENFGIIPEVSEIKNQNGKYEFYNSEILTITIYIPHNEKVQNPGTRNRRILQNTKSTKSKKRGNAGKGPGKKTGRKSKGK